MFVTFTSLSAFVAYLIGKRLSRSTEIQQTISFLKRRRTVDRNVTFIAF